MKGGENITTVTLKQATHERLMNYLGGYMYATSRRYDSMMKQGFSKDDVFAKYLSELFEELPAFHDKVEQEVARDKKAPTQKAEARA